MVTLKARLVNIGNSRGIRIPKPLIEEAGLSDDVELHVKDGVITIASANPPRTGWAEAARTLAGETDVGHVAPTVATKFEDDEWHW